MNVSQLKDWPFTGPFNPSWLGEGKYNTVRRGLYCGTPVAIKRFKSPEFEDSEEMMRIKANEIQMLETLRHPHIVTMIAHDSQDTILMEMYSSNATRLDNLSDLTTVGRDCMRAIVYMQTHQGCFSHGDIHPKKILVTRRNDGFVTKAALCGLGAARSCSVDTFWTGTEGYMPEANPDVNSTHDVFGLAVSLLDGFFLENVRSSFRKNIVGNTDKFIERLPEDIGLVLSTMLKITRNQTIGNDHSIKTRFLNDMLDTWTALAHNYRGVDREGNNTAPIHTVLSPEQIEQYVGKEPRQMPIIETLPPPRDFDERRWYDPRRLLGDSRARISCSKHT